MGIKIEKLSQEEIKKRIGIVSPDLHSLLQDYPVAFKQISSAIATFLKEEKKGGAKEEKK